MAIRISSTPVRVTIEIAGEIDQLDLRPRVVPAHGQQALPGFIGAAVVDEDDFVVITAAGKRTDYSILKGGNVFRFVIAWSNKA